MTDGAPVQDNFGWDLVAALGGLSELRRNQTANAGTYTYSYADLASVLGYVRPALLEHGFAVSQDVESSEDGRVVGVRTNLLHRSGQTHPGTWLRLQAGANAQVTGSAISYARRYSLLATLGLATSDDDGVATTQADRNDEPEQPTARFITVFERAKAWGTRDPAAAATLKGLAELAGFKLTERNLHDNPDFLDAIEEALDGFDATAAQEAHTGPQLPANQKEEVH